MDGCPRERWASGILRAPSVLLGLWWKLGIIIVSLSLHGGGSLCLFIIHIHIHIYIYVNISWKKAKGNNIGCKEGIDTMINDGIEFPSYLQCNFILFCLSFSSFLSYNGYIISLWEIPFSKGISVIIFIKISGLLKESCIDFMGHSSSNRTTAASLSWMCPEMGLEWDAADLEQGLVPRHRDTWRLKPHYHGSGCPSQTSSFATTALATEMKTKLLSEPVLLDHNILNKHMSKLR